MKQQRIALDHELARTVRRAQDDSHRGFDFAAGEQRLLETSRNERARSGVRSNRPRLVALLAAAVLSALVIFLVVRPRPLTFAASAAPSSIPFPSSQEQRPSRAHAGA